MTFPATDLACRCLTAASERIGRPHACPRDSSALRQSGDMREVLARGSGRGVGWRAQAKQPDGRITIKKGDMRPAIADRVEEQRSEQSSG